MKKLMLSILTILLVGVFALPAAAVPVEALTTLAGYFPEGSVAYASVRTDDDIITTLDGLVGQVGEAVPELGGLTLTEALDAASADIKDDATFEELFRSWLGDTAAAGVLPFTMMDEFGAPVTLIVISITDRDAAEAFFNSMTRPRDYTQTIGEGYTTYEHQRGTTHVAFRDDVMLISSSFAAIENGGTVDAPLSSSDVFNTTLGLLPESDYNGVIYIDTPALLNFALLAATAMDSSMGEAEDMVMGMLAATQPQAVGFTMLDDHSLVIDAVTATTPESMGMSAALNTPLDLAFVEHIPAGTPLVVLGTNFGDAFILGQALLAQMSETQGMDFQSGSSEVELGIWALEFVVRGFTSLNFQEEILPAINGTYALYAGVNPAAENATDVTELLIPELLVDFALAFQVTDAATATTLRENLNATLHALPEERQDNIDISFEDINGIEVAVFGIETMVGFNPYEVEMMLAISDDVFVFGTRRFVEAALSPDVGLDQDAQWQEALQYVVPNSYSMLYQSSDNLVNLGNLLQSTPSSDVNQLGVLVTALTDLVSSSSISYGSTDDDITWTRAVLTLNGE